MRIFEQAFQKTSKWPIDILFNHMTNQRNTNKNHKAAPKVHKNWQYHILAKIEQQWCH